MNARCAHCGSDTGLRVSGPSAQCAYCRGWSLLGQAGPTALDVAKLPIRVDRNSLVASLGAHARNAGAGNVEVLETRTDWVPYLARQGSVRVVGRELSGRILLRLEGLVGVSLGPDRSLPVELIEPRALAEASDWSRELPPISLDEFDQLVRDRIASRMREETAERGFTLADIDVHPAWGPRAHLIFVPILVVTFRSGATYSAQFSFHDGEVRSLDLPGLVQRLSPVAEAVDRGRAIPPPRIVRLVVAPHTAAVTARSRDKTEPPTLVPAAASALSCSTCGAPLDLASAEGASLSCSACRNQSALAAHGIERIRRFELPAPLPEHAEQALRAALARDGGLPSHVEFQPASHVYLARNAWMVGSVYGHVVVRRGNGPGPFAEPVEEFQDYSTTREVRGPVAVRSTSDAPVLWFEVGEPDKLLPRGETLVTGVDLVLRNFDEALRHGIGMDLEEYGSRAGWKVGYVDVTGQTHGELLELWVPSLLVRYQLVPRFGRVWDPPGSDGWYSAWYTDGRIIGPLPRCPPNKWLSLSLIAGVLAVLVVGFALLLLVLFLLGAR